jgi:bifunctional DNA-binding transcriptional regulator/antitoxin component of YhaV-PrlF toxin-antitoxin module
MSKVYNYEELFQDIPGDPDNFLFTIPPEMLEETGWKAGDTLNISVENGSIVLSKKDTTVT